MNHELVPWTKLGWHCWVVDGHTRGWSYGHRGEELVVRRRGLRYWRCRHCGRRRTETLA